MQFLLERLAGDPRASFGTAAPFDQGAAVAAQIQRIVSARVVEDGNGELSLIEFGMPAIVDVSQSSKTQLERYADRLMRLIQRYEPRLKQPRVALEATRHALMPYRLVVTGFLGPDSDPLTFHFDLPGH